MGKGTELPRNERKPPPMTRLRNALRSFIVDVPFSKGAVHFRFGGK
jgi:hypothetical protein